MNSAIDRREWSAACSRGKTPPFPLVTGYEAGWGPRVGLDQERREILTLPGIEAGPFGPIARHYTKMIQAQSHETDEEGSHETQEGSDASCSYVICPWDFITNFIITIIMN
jgi:hypothetical protein